MALRKPTTRESLGLPPVPSTPARNLESGLGQMPADLRPAASPQPGVELQPGAVLPPSPAAEYPIAPPADSDAWGRLAACEEAVIALRTDIHQIERVLVDLDNGINRLNRSSRGPTAGFESRKADIAPVTPEEEAAYSAANLAALQGDGEFYDGIADWRTKTGGLHGKPA